MSARSFFQHYVNPPADRLASLLHEIHTNPSPRDHRCMVLRRQGRQKNQHRNLLTGKAQSICTDGCFFSDFSKVQTLSIVFTLKNELLINNFRTNPNMAWMTWILCYPVIDTVS